MNIAFKFHYIHDNGLFVRLSKRIAERSTLPISHYKEEKYHVIEAAGDQGELEPLAELVSTLVPQSLYLKESLIEEVQEPRPHEDLSDEQDPSAFYCPECQGKIVEELDPFIPCSVCECEAEGLGIEALASAHGLNASSGEELFTQLADLLLEKKSLKLSTFKGERSFSLLSEEEGEGEGILICDPSDISSYFLITQGELNAMMLIEKPSVSLKPKLKFRVEYELNRAMYPVFFADEKITLALSTALAKKGVFSLKCDNIPSLRAASALEQHVVVEGGEDILPWTHPTKLEQAVHCSFDGYEAFGDNDGLKLGKEQMDGKRGVHFVAKNAASSRENVIRFEPSHGAMRSIVLEHGLQGKSLCGIYLSRQHPSQLFSFSSKIGYTSMAQFSYDIPEQPQAFMESISQMDEAGERLVENYKKGFPELYEKVIHSSFDPDPNASMLTRLWAMAALFIGISSQSDIQAQCRQLEATALEFNGKSGPRIDYKIMKTEDGYVVDPRLAIRSAMSFKLAGVDEFLLSFGFIDSFADFIAEQAELSDANIGIDGVALSGSLFENRQLLMRTYNALSSNYKIYRNERLSMDGANVAIGALTLGSE